MVRISFMAFNISGGSPEVSSGKVYINGLKGSSARSKERLIKHHDVFKNYHPLYLMDMESDIKSPRHCSFSLPAIASPCQPAEHSLFGLGLGLLDGHLIFYALYAGYVVDVFGGQVLFRCVFGLAS